MDLLSGLNERQIEAVTLPIGPALVLAGPGSGKTRVLTHRVVYLVRHAAVPVSHLMAVTFTNKAAREMRSRLAGMLGPDTAHLSIGTFHAACARILRREAPLVGLTPTYTILDDDDQVSLVRRVIKELNLDDKTYTPGRVLSEISRAKNELVTPDQYRAKTYWHEQVARAYPLYQSALRSNNAADFDDLLMQVALLFRDQPEVLARYRGRFQHLLVDEFQDTNMAQYVIVNQLASVRRSLFVVADEDQSIYSWRGADFRNIDRFRRDFAEARVILLERNYRSSQAILDVANQVISHNTHRTPKRLSTVKPGGLPATVFEAYDEKEEASFVVHEIQRLVQEGLARYGDCAVMYRTNAQSRTVEEAFLDEHLPYRLIGATRFYERREIKDIVAYLRMLYNPDDSVSLARIINVPPRSLGSKTTADLFAAAGRAGRPVIEVLREARESDSSPFSRRAQQALDGFLTLWEDLREIAATQDLVTLIDQTLARTGFGAYLHDGTQEGEDRWENVQELRQGAGDYLKEAQPDQLAAFLQDVALISDADELEDQPDSAVMLTLHLAKGLEFPVVFMVGMNEGLLPHSRSETPEQIEEERRLCYVGITRAKERLYLVHAFRRSTFGRNDPAAASRFLKEIPLQFVRRYGRGGARGVGYPAASEREVAWSPPTVAEIVRGAPSEPRSAEQQFHPGERVRHPVFGRGTVVSSALANDDEEVTVAFENRQGVRRLLVSLAHLEKLG